MVQHHTYTDTPQPPRQASPATPPKEGNCLPPQEGNWWRGAVEMVQTRHNHPVRLRRRVQTRYDCSSVFVLVISPPQEGNWWRGAVEMVQTRHNHPVRLRLPPLHRRGIGGAGRSRWYRPGTTTPSGFACHPSAGGELAGAEPTQPPRQASPPRTDAIRLQ